MNVSLGRRNLGTENPRSLEGKDERAADRQGPGQTYGIGRNFEAVKAGRSSRWPEGG